MAPIFRPDPEHAPPAPLAWADGRLMPLEEARIPIEDRGLQFGQSAYEVLLARNGRLLAGAAHLARLDRSAAGIGLDPDRYRETVGRALQALLAAASPVTAQVHVQVTGGVAPRSYLPAGSGPLPGVYLTWRAHDLGRFRDSRQSGISVVTLPDERWRHPEFKTTQLVAPLLAKRQAAAAGADEALLVDQEGMVTEGSNCTVLVVRASGELVTPPLSRGILPGVTRALLLQELPGRLREEDVNAASLHAAREVMIASTTRPVIAVTAVDGRPVGAGRPGPCALELADMMDALIDEHIGHEP